MIGASFLTPRECAGTPADKTQRSSTNMFSGGQQYPAKPPQVCRSRYSASSRRKTTAQIPSAANPDVRTVLGHIVGKCFPMCEPAQCCCQNTFKSTTFEKKLSFFVFKCIFYFGLKITISISIKLQLFQYMTSKEAMLKTYINIQVYNWSNNNITVLNVSHSVWLNIPNFVWTDLIVAGPAKGRGHTGGRLGRVTLWWALVAFKENSIFAQTRNLRERSIRKESYILAFLEPKGPETFWNFYIEIILYWKLLSSLLK